MTTLRCTLALGLAALTATAFLLSPAAAARADDGQVRGDPRSPVPVFVLEKDRFAAFDPPGECAQDFVDINNRGQIAGGYKEDCDTSSDQPGWLRQKRDKFTEINVPGAVVTSPLGINGRGDIVGAYDRADGTKRGFLRDKWGRTRTIRVQGAVYTQAWGINNHGQVVGDYLGPDGINHGFLWHKGRFTTIDGPDGAGATLTDINENGDIIGVYADPTDSGTFAGFVLRKGRYTAFAAPGANFTLPVGINNRRQIVGVTSVDDPGAGVGYHGFLLSKGPNGPFTPVDFPGAPSTLATGIDDHGRIVGVYVNPNAEPAAQRADANQSALLAALPSGLMEK